MGSKYSRNSRREIRNGYAYIMPALIFMVAMIGFPILYNFYISFFDMTAQSVGMGHAESSDLRTMRRFSVTRPCGRLLKIHFSIRFFVLYFSL